MGTEACGRADKQRHHIRVESDYHQRQVLELQSLVIQDAGERTIERVARTECHNCPQRYIDEVMHHRLVLRILRVSLRTMLLPSRLPLETVPFSRRLLLLRHGKIVSRQHQYDYGQVGAFFPKPKSRIRKTTCTTVTSTESRRSTRRRFGDRGGTFDQRHGYVLCLCYRLQLSAPDVEYTVRKHDGAPKAFVHDFDKVVLLESSISVDKALTRLLTQLSYPNEGEWGALFENTFRTAATQLVDNECHLI